MKGEIKLRPLENSDIDFLFQVENDVSLWNFSNTQTPYSKYVLERYLKHSHLDIFEAKQYRQVVVNERNQPIGLIDLFDFEPKHRRAEVGIVVVEEYREKGVAKRALELIEFFALDKIRMHQLYAHISVENDLAKKLFQSIGYEKVGLKKEWNFYDGAYHDELIVQKIIDV